MLRSKQSTLIMVGNAAPMATSRLAAARFSGWKSVRAAVTVAVPVSYLAPSVMVTDMPNAGLARVVVARLAIASFGTRYYTLSFGNTVLGGSFMHD